MRDIDQLPRLARLTAMLLKLQSKSHVSVQELARHFEVSKRTIYRDLASLEQSGVPLVPIEGKGYGLMEGYKLPPVTFSEAEANALIMAEMFISKTKDSSLIAEFQSAIDKIKSVMREEAQQKAEFLAERTIIGKNWSDTRTSSFLSEIQKALTNRHVMQMTYRKQGSQENSSRQVEPFAIYHNMDENWVLIAWCRLRQEFRSFRIDRIQQLITLSEAFSPHDMTLDEYVEIQRLRHEQRTVT